MKTEYQLDKERQLPGSKEERRRITKASPYHDASLKVGEVVIVKRWGTFGCWDKDGRWVHYYSSEPA